MYIISQFSKITGLTIKALRYYDEKGILIPSYRDKENLYRYYNDEDIKKAQLIKYLRSLNFSIMEITETLSLVEDQNDLTYILQEKIKYIENNISREKELINKINSNTITINNELQNNNYEITITDVEEIFVASLRFTGEYQELEKYVPLLYKVVKNNKTGPHFNCYFDDDYAKQANIELCIPIKKEISNSAVKCIKLPKITALHTVHYGDYNRLYLAYRAVFKYANKHQIKISTPIREVYVKCPGIIFKGNPANYITEIFFPIEK